MAKKRVTKATYLKWYEDMLFWRKFEDMSAALYIQQKIIITLKAEGWLKLYIVSEISIWPIVVFKCLNLLKPLIFVQINI